uniref:Uncharacterized protein n=1 Tax=Fundulus heteroclitus TaxID=8078 RepID=A0A3Q2QXT1_FUNHE
MLQRSAVQSSASTGRQHVEEKVWQQQGVWGWTRRGLQRLQDVGHADVSRTCSTAARGRKTSRVCPTSKLPRWLVGTGTPWLWLEVSLLCVLVAHGLLPPVCLRRSPSLRVSPGGQIFSWGQNRYGQLGLGLTGQSISTPQLVQSLQGIPFAQLSAGGAHSFALTLSGAVFGWGCNKFGHLTLIWSFPDRCFPALLKSLRSQSVIYVSCGEDHTAVLTKEGGVFTFGAGGYGQLGHNSTNHEINPRKVFELMGNVVTQIACGRIYAGGDQSFAHYCTTNVSMMGKSLSLCR